MIGRVVDEAEAAILDAEIVLRSYSHPTPDYTTTTNRLGEFVLVLPLPESPDVDLRVSATPFHTVHRRHFGWSNSADAPPLQEGTMDVGTIRLETAGSVTGLVLDVDGRPIPDALVFFVPGPQRSPWESIGPGAAERDARANTDETGLYTCDHLLPGANQLFVEALGYESPPSAAVTILPEAQVEVPPIRLSPTPSLSGRVMDEAGQGLDGATVEVFMPLYLTLPETDACQSEVASIAEAKTGANGDFLVHLPEARVLQDHLCVSASLFGYETARNSVRPGATDIRLVLPKATMSTFTVVDGVTGSPVEQFTLTAIEPFGFLETSNDRWQGPSHHPGGTTELAAEPDRHCYQIDAPGYTPQRGPIVQASPAQREQKIVLQPAGSITGRVVFDGKPVAHLTVACNLPDRWEEPEESISSRCESPYLGPDQRVMTDAQGKFTLTSLGTGQYRLSIEAYGFGDFDSLVDAAAGDQRDVGEIQLDREARIHGSFVYPSGVFPEERRFVRVTLQRDEELDWDVAQIDEQGRFEFRSLAPGKYRIDATFWRNDEMAELPSVSEELVLEPGSTRELRIDLSSVTPSRVSVRVKCGAIPLEGAIVRVRPLDGRRLIELGRTDAAGLVSGWCVPGRRAELDLRSSLGLPLATTPHTLASNSGEPIELTVCPIAGMLTVQWPAMGRVEEILLMVSYKPAYARTTSTQLVIDSSSPPPGTSIGLDSCQVGQLQPGEYRVRLELRAAGTSTRFSRKRVSVLADQESVCAFSERDLIR